MLLSLVGDFALNTLFGAAGFIIGALVFRNNSAKFNELIEKIKDLENKIK